MLSCDLPYRPPSSPSDDVSELSDSEAGALYFLSEFARQGNLSRYVRVFAWQGWRASWWRGPSAPVGRIAAGASTRVLEELFVAMFANVIMPFVQSK